MYLTKLYKLRHSYFFTFMFITNILLTSRLFHKAVKVEWKKQVFDQTPMTTSSSAVYLQENILS